MVSDSILKEATDRLVSRFHPEKIILFGSQARGDAHEHSDVDLLVVCQFAGKRRRLMVEMDRAICDLDMGSDISILTPEEFELDRPIIGTLAHPVSLEGRILYEH